MPTHTIELSEQADAYLRAAVEAGEYSSISAALEDALGFVEDEGQDTEEEKLAWLQKAAQDGFAGAAGPEAIVLRSDEEIEAYLQEKLRRVLAAEDAGAQRVRSAA